MAETELGAREPVPRFPLRRRLLFDEPTHKSLFGADDLGLEPYARSTPGRIRTAT
jgi:hypothetical protein